MPNWCYNRVDIYIEDDKEREEFIEFVKGTLDNEGKVEIPFSFASIIPEPDYATTPVAKTFPGVKAEFAKTEEEKEVALKNEPTIRDNAWWDWRIQNWGTKWDLSDEIEFEVDGDSIHMQFQTAWGPPSGIYNALTEKFPDIGITWFYDEPGMEFAGYLNNDND